MFEITDVDIPEEEESTNDYLVGNIEGLLNIANTLQENKEVCRGDIVSIEAFDASWLLDDSYPLVSFTAKPTQTNLNVAIENIAVNAIKGTVKLIGSIFKSIYTVLAAIIKAFLRLFGFGKSSGGSGGSNGGSKPATKAEVTAAVETVKKAEISVKDKTIIACSKAMDGSTSELLCLLQDKGIRLDTLLKSIDNFMTAITRVVTTLSATIISYKRVDLTAIDIARSLAKPNIYVPLYAAYPKEFFELDEFFKLGLKEVWIPKGQEVFRKEGSHDRLVYDSPKNAELVTAIKTAAGVRGENISKKLDRPDWEKFYRGDVSQLPIIVSTYKVDVLADIVKMLEDNVEAIKQLEKDAVKFNQELIDNEIGHEEGTASLTAQRILSSHCAKHLQLVRTIIAKILIPTSTIVGTIGATVITCGTELAKQNEILVAADKENDKEDDKK